LVACQSGSDRGGVCRRLIGVKWPVGPGGAPGRAGTDRVQQHSGDAVTRATFTERLRACDRLWRWVCVMACLLDMLAFAAGPQLAQALLEPWWGRPERSEERRARILAWTGVATLIMSGVALLMLLLVIWGGRWTARKFGLLCPSCGARLVRYRYAALGAGTCGRCQARVVEDAPASLSEAPLPMRDEFLARLGEYKAAYQRDGQWQVPAVLLCFLPGLLVAWPFSAYVEPCLRPAGLMWLAVPLFFGVLGSPFLVCCYCVSRCESRLQQRHGVVCRWCGAAFTGTRGKTAGVTGRCGACGQPAWSDTAAPTLPPAGPA